MSNTIHYLWRADLPITFSQASEMFDLTIQSYHTAAAKGKLRCIHAGQGGYAPKRIYNNITTPRHVNEWRAAVRERKPAALSIGWERRLFKLFKEYAEMTA